MVAVCRSLVSVAAVGVLVLSGCAGSDFVAVAEGEGIQVYEQQLARDTVVDLCRSFDENANPMGALFALASKRANDPPFSTNDARVLQLGIDNQCSQHSEVFAGLRAVFSPNAGTGAGLGGEPAPHSEAPVPPVVLPFGEQIATDEGAQVSMIASVLEDWDPTEQIPGEMVKLTVTVTNNSMEALDPGMVVGNMLSREGGPVQEWAVAPGSTFGADAGFRSSQGDLLPGESETFDKAVEMVDARNTATCEGSNIRRRLLRGRPYADWPHAAHYARVR